MADVICNASRAVLDVGAIPRWIEISEEFQHRLLMPSIDAGVDMIDVLLNSRVIAPPPRQWLALII